MLKYLLVFLLVFSCNSLFAQNYDKEFETQFVWEVKQIDEFIERFNNNDTTLLKKYYQTHDSTKVLTRENLIKSLFNFQKKDWDIAEIKSFIKDADDKDSPKYLDMFGDKWDARVTCSVTYKGKPETAVLTLQLQSLPDNAHKWVVTDADAPFLQSALAANKIPFHMPYAVDSTKSLNPMSHATDFMEISRVSEDRINIADYFQDPDKCSPETQLFVQECLNTHIKVLSAKNVTYNFLQIKGWDIEIQQFNRADNNSGWLISKLTKISSD